MASAEPPPLSVYFSLSSPLSSPQSCYITQASLDSYITHSGLELIILLLHFSLVRAKITGVCHNAWLALFLDRVAY